MMDDVVGLQNKLPRLQDSTAGRAPDASLYSLKSRTLGLDKKVEGSDGNSSTSNQLLPQHTDNRGVSDAPKMKAKVAGLVSHPSISTTTTTLCYLSFI